MASQLPPSLPTPTTITCLGDDLLREIFLRLPTLPSLVRAAFACCAFRRVVRLSPAFRRSFRALHAPPLLAFFLEPNFQVAPAFPCPWRSCDPDLIAANFFDIRNDDAKATWWEVQTPSPSFDGYFLLDNVSRSTSAYYNPLTQAMILSLNYIELQFYTLSSEDGQVPSRVVCVIRERGRWDHGRWELQPSERAAVFSSKTMEWQLFPKSTLPMRDGATPGRVIRGLIWWPNWMYDQIVLVDTVTFEFSLLDVPTPSFKESDDTTYKLGETKDGKLCLVDIKDDMLVSHFLTADNDSGIKRWMLYKEFPLHPIVKNLTGCSMEEEECHVRVQVEGVIHGFVYLSILCCGDTQSCELYLSLCLETLEVCELFKYEYRDIWQAHPYIMAWPPALLQSKEESETEFTGDSVADDGPIGTEKASSVLVAALQSLRQALIDDSSINKEISAALDAYLRTNEGDNGINKDIAARLDAFLPPNEDGDGSLIGNITNLDAQLITARDRILRISP